MICMVLILLWILDYRYGSEVICECKCYGMGKWIVVCMFWNIYGFVGWVCYGGVFI